MCDYVNDHWDESTPIHLAAYVMWRLNWIHPFADGNGRTSRIISYVVLSVRAGALLPGTPTIPDQIVDNRIPYFEALDSADLACRAGRVDVSRMEDLLAALLANQLASFYKFAGGKLPGA
jgi:prophage maintenance system killer protein